MTNPYCQALLHGKFSYTYVEQKIECSRCSRGISMNEEPDIERIKKEILERAIYRYEMRIADLRSQLDQTVIHTRV